jgi:Ca2+-transporting ATPase
MTVGNPADTHAPTRMNTPLPDGLTTATAAQRHAAEGPNELTASQRRTLLDMAWDVVREPMFLLLGAGAIYLAHGRHP